MMETSNHEFFEKKKSYPHKAYYSFYAFKDGLLKVLNALSTAVVGVVTEQRMA